MKAVVVTGATSGIGLAVAGLLAEKYHIIGIGRDAEKCEAAQRRMREAGRAATYFRADLMQQDQVRDAARRIQGELDAHFSGELHALINNAGCVRSWYMTTRDGYEQQFALNYLAGFLMTHELMPALKKGRGRILFTSSASHKMMRVNWKSIMYSRRYRPLRAYKQSKLCNMLLAYGINWLFDEDGVRAYGVDPGLVRTDIGNKGTGGMVDFVWKLRKKGGVLPQEPAKTYKMLCDGNPRPIELYYKFLKPERYSRQVNEKNAERLIALSEQLCGVRFGGE
ncbi:MAG: SDR family NAD(P)-dependent oxidoreductase [Christensenellales bacterium]